MVWPPGSAESARDPPRPGAAALLFATLHIARRVSESAPTTVITASGTRMYWSFQASQASIPRKEPSTMAKPARTSAHLMKLQVK